LLTDTPATQSVDTVMPAAPTRNAAPGPGPSPERSNLLTVGECPTGEGATMPAESSFDIVSRIDRQEVDNALKQAAKAIGTPLDFRGVGASIAWSGDHAIDIRANSEERAKAVLDVFKDKLVKRGVSLKALDSGDPRLSGKEYRLGVGLKEGISADDARKISKLIRDEAPKGVRAQAPGAERRVSSKKKEDLQAVHAPGKGQK